MLTYAQAHDRLYVRKPGNLNHLPRRRECWGSLWQNGVFSPPESPNVGKMVGKMRLREVGSEPLSTRGNPCTC